jgi:RNA polymerase sigma factor (sigma-70 family)
MSEPSLDEGAQALVAAARCGDRAALETLLRRAQPVVRRLATRMLWNPEDANDAAQEILIKVVTGLATFEGRSRFSTWLYRIAVNTLVSFRRSRMEAMKWSFERFGEDLGRGLDEAVRDESPSPESAALLEEVKIGCTLGMLLCLDRDHRIAYVLGEIMELDGGEAAAALDIAPAAFRQRLSRARRRIEDFTRSHCGIVEPANACRCARRLGSARDEGRVDPQRLSFAADDASEQSFTAAVAQVRSLEGARRVAALHRTNDRMRSDRDIAAAILALLDTGAGPAAAPFCD